MSITFRGVSAQSLGGFLTVRGYAKLSELAHCSVADLAYQREIKDNHRQEISQFYQRGEYLFFPEIVLSLELQVNYAEDGIPSNDPLQMVLAGQKFRSNVNQVEVAPTKTKSAAELQRVNITLPNEGDKPLKRIDGNHRLRAFEAIDGDPVNDRLAPFCIILFSQNQAQQSEKALFYNINSKVLPLNSEEVYKGIIDDIVSFDDGVLERDFGKEFLLCRKLLPRLDFNFLKNLKGICGQILGGTDCRRSVIIEVLRTHKILNSEEAFLEGEELFQAIIAVHEIYNHERLKTSVSQGLFIAFLHIALNNCLPARFMNWVLKNHIYELNEINAVDLIHVFEKVANSKRHQIFVSMQFSEATEANYKAIQNAVNDVNVAHKLDIRLREIRIDQFNTGYSYQINDEILRLIEESGLLIADLTCGNKNVYHEIGYLMGLNQGKGLSQENFILLHNGGISEASKDIGFNLAGIKQLRIRDTNSLRDDIKKQIEIFYGLRCS